MSVEFDSVVLSRSVYYKGENPVYGESRVVIELDDEAAGCYFVLSDDEGKIRVDYDQLVMLAELAGEMKKEYEDTEQRDSSVEEKYSPDKIKVIATRGE